VASLSSESGKGLDLSAGGAALLVMDSCRRACLKEPQGSGGAAIMKRLQRSWRPDGAGEAQWLRPAELAKRVGLQKDYLNRLVRRATGLTLGQWRDRELLRAAEASLRQGHRVAAVASDLGFSDANYFARWFRKQTGLSPSHWSNR
jgi:AraC family L-rhamnose operon transcriptional activator RhaR